MLELSPLDWASVGCLALGAMLMAGDQAVKDAPALRAKLHWRGLGGRWRYLPLALFVGAAGAFIGNRLLQRTTSASHSTPPVASSAQVQPAPAPGPQAETPSREWKSAPVSHASRRLNAGNTPIVNTGALDFRPGLAVSGSPGSIIAPSGGVNTVFNGPPHIPDGLYQDGQLVGRVGPVTDASAVGRYVFAGVRFTAAPDFSRALEYGGLQLRCEDIGIPPQVAASAQIGIATDGPYRCSSASAEPSARAPTASIHDNVFKGVGTAIRARGPVQLDAGRNDFNEVQNALDLGPNP